MGFRRVREDFRCGRCRRPTAGDGYTNHCRHCLWSRHVDVTPGDRAAHCGALMEPVEALTRGEGYVLTHRCRGCGAERSCRTSAGDDVAAVLEVARASAQRRAGRG